MKQIPFFILSSLLCLFFSCTSRKHTKPLYTSYMKVLDTLPELRIPVLKKLKRFDKSIQVCYVVPFFKSQMDTMPSLDLFLSGEYKDHLVFSGLDNSVISPWYIKDFEHNRYLVYTMNNIKSSDYAREEIELMFQKGAEMAFSIGAEAGPNIPTFIKTKDNVILYYFDRETQKNKLMSIEEYLKLHPEFIEKMPLPYLKMKAIKNE